MKHENLLNTLANHMKCWIVTLADLFSKKTDNRNYTWSLASIESGSLLKDPAHQKTHHILYFGLFFPHFQKNWIFLDKLLSQKVQAQLLISSHINSKQLLRFSFTKISPNPISLNHFPYWVSLHICKGAKRYRDFQQFLVTLQLLGSIWATHNKIQ